MARAFEQDHPVSVVRHTISDSSIEGPKKELGDHASQAS